jgi:uncharacterized repeat protein (TIGR03803 family)
MPSIQISRVPNRLDEPETCGQKPLQMFGKSTRQVHLACLFVACAFTNIDAADDWVVQDVYSFGGTTPDGAFPNSELLEHTDGFLYGSAPYGGLHGGGTLFKVNLAGTTFQVLHHFDPSNHGGFVPQGGVTLGADGNLYGVTQKGGVEKAGTLFSIGTSGAGYSTLHQFRPSQIDGANPERGLTFDTEGYLYGVTPNGGTNNFGTAFRIKTDGTEYGILHHFGGPADGRFPNGELLLQSDNTLLGVARMGGINDAGTVFRIDLADLSYSTLIDHGGAQKSPFGKLVKGPANRIYGVTRLGGGWDGGSGYYFLHDGTGLTTFHYFNARADMAGSDPASVVTVGSNGRVYVLTHTAQQTERGALFQFYPDDVDAYYYDTIFKFNHVDALGYHPSATLIEASDGRFYGATDLGGSSRLGVLFSLDLSDMQYRIVHDFAAPLLDGQNPVGRLSELDSGELVGMTSRGGTGNVGTVFKFSPQTGAYSKLHDFTGNTFASTGTTSLTVGSDGQLYGSIDRGGDLERGYVFRISPAGSDFQVIHNWTGDHNLGFWPFSPVMEAADGLLYGVAHGGHHGRGTIYQLARDGSTYSVIYHFGANLYDGTPGEWGIIEGSNGKLIGYAKEGGTNVTASLYSIGKDGSGFEILHHFGPDSESTGWGACPIEDQNSGYLYGLASEWGVLPNAVLYRIRLDGDGYEELARFDPQVGVGDPYVGIISGPDNGLYGSGYNDYLGTGRSFFYRMNPDGTEFSKLTSDATNSTNDIELLGKVILGRDAAFYGYSPRAGHLQYGTIKRITPRLRLTTVNFNSSGASMSLSGQPKWKYEVEKAGGLPASSWQTMGTSEVGHDGTLQFVDPEAPNPSSGFYRFKPVR